MGDKAFHIFDYEGNDKEHADAFENTIQKIKEAEKLKGKI